MADRISSIYEKACAKGILDPQTQSEQWFRDQLSTEQGVKSFYDHATANGMKFHPYPEFKERLSQPVSSQPSSAQPAQLDAQIEGIKRWSRSKKKIVWFVLEDGTELPLRYIGDGMYMTLAPDVMTGVYFGFTEEYLAVAGAKRVEKPSASV